MTTYEPEFEKLHEDANEGPRSKAFSHFVWRNKVVYFFIFVLLGVGFDQWTKIWAQDALAVFAEEARYVSDHGTLDETLRYTLSESPVGRLRIQLSSEAKTQGVCNKIGLPLASDDGESGYRILGQTISLHGNCQVENPTADDVELTAIYKVKGFRHENTVVIIPQAFNFRYAENRAAAFSLTSSLPFAVRRPLLVSVAALAMLLLVGWFFTLKKPDGLLMTAFLCIISGAIGNFLDRARLGYVIDFIDWRLGFINEKWPPWPTFNIADVLIVVGAGLVILRTLRPLYPEDEPAPKSTDKDDHKS